jgi:abhydrolase domain-containing protein 17
MGNKLSTLVEGLMFQAPEASYNRDKNLVWLKTKTGDIIPTYYIKINEEKPTIMFSHANAEDLGMIVYFMKDIARSMRVNCLLYDYPGYGLASGKSNEESFYAAAEVAYT